MNEKSPKLSERERRLTESRMKDDADLLGNGAAIREDGALEVPAETVEKAKEMMEDESFEKQTIKVNDIEIDVDKTPNGYFFYIKEHYGEDNPFREPKDKLRDDIMYSIRTSEIDKKGVIEILEKIKPIIAKRHYISAKEVRSNLYDLEYKITGQKIWALSESLLGSEDHVSGKFQTETKKLQEDFVIDIRKKKDDLSFDVIEVVIKGTTKHTNKDGSRPVYDWPFLLMEDGSVREVDAPTYDPRSGNNPYEEFNKWNLLWVLQNLTKNK